MSLIQKVREDRKGLSDVLQKHAGLRRFVQDLYPDKAHFIYELLQNAEDVCATEASFMLNDDFLEFHHNGRAFTEEDVWAITDIGKDDKLDKEDMIGRFGVGFKSVFTYCETPHIWSPTYSFNISKLVLPNEIRPLHELDDRTIFRFPFNNPKKKKKTAFFEIQNGLNELAETTLLFLTNLKVINWKVGNGNAKKGHIRRINHSKYHVEIHKRINGKKTKTYHYLKFMDLVKNHETQNVAIAFELVFLPEVKQFRNKNPIAKQLRISPATRGRVAVYFPAEKETSGLRFHIHAPFVPEVSRASVKDTDVNDPLFEQISVLVAASLNRIRELGLLSRGFLGTLPNASDQIPERYQRIREKIVAAMKIEMLTPIHGGNGHAAASNMLQSRAALKNLLTADDLAFFFGEEKFWVASPTQRNNNVDKFLQQLDIKDWNVENILKNIDSKSSRDEAYSDRTGILDWLSKKSSDWHQQFYALLGEVDSYRDSHPATSKPIRQLYLSSFTGDFEFEEKFQQSH